MVVFFAPSGPDARSMQVLRSEHAAGEEVCEVWYVPGVLSPGLRASAEHWLAGLSLCRGEAFGRPLARQQGWFHPSLRRFCPGWRQADHLRWKPHPYTALLQQLQAAVQAAVQELGIATCFSGCLVNHYVNGDDYIQLHRDEAYGPRTTVAGLSLGATRTMQWQAVPYNPDCPRSLKLQEPGARTVTCRLEPGSVLVMAGATQKHWAHGIAPEPAVRDARFSLTFRE